MKLVIFEDDCFENFYPLTYPRPIFELRCGALSLAAKVERQVGQKADAYLVRDYLVETFSARAGGAKVNDLSGIAPGEEVLFVNGRLLADKDWKAPKAPGAMGCQKSVSVWRTTADVRKIRSFADILAAAPADRGKCDATCFNWMWEVMLTSVEQIGRDFAAAGRSFVESELRPDVAVFGDRKNLAIHSDVDIHPFVVLDTRHGPITIESGSEVHPFTRIEGPCYVGPKCTLLGAKVREGCSFGPVCRVGGEVEESIIHGYSNKYHDGFLGHAYVCEWVNLGALTTNSDLKNDYGSVDVHVTGKLVASGSTKVGSFIGDHVKTSIGTLLNTGSVVGTFALLMAIGKPLPKFIPPFAWYLEGAISRGFGKQSLFDTAVTAMGRRKKVWTEADLRLYEHIYALTDEERKHYIKKDRRKLLGR
ncbi:MAG: hypothetical protein BIFFINMI_02311 [Phycisphaerae bacterium]|nr:hypothetical protein [Phycisphaerae bacterium]